MKRNKILTILSGCILGMLAMLSGCDRLENDTLPQPQTIDVNTNDVVVIPGQSTIIDLTEGIASTSVALDVNITRQPEKGTLEGIGIGLYKYDPSKEFVEGSDFFAFEVKSGNAILGTDSVDIIIGDTTDIGCQIIAIEDQVDITGDSVAVIPVLDNDIICDSLGTVSLEVIYAPGHGSAEVQGSNILYTPDASLVERDWFIYQICAEDVCSKGYVVIEKTDSMPPINFLSLEDDYYSVTSLSIEDTLLLDVLANDSVLFMFDSIETSISQFPSYGYAFFDVDNKIIYNPEPGHTPPYTDVFKYMVCAGSECGEATVTVEVTGDSTGGCIIQAYDDYYTLQDSTFGDSTTVHYLNVTFNDDLCGEDSLEMTIINPPSFGTVSVDGLGIYYQADSVMVDDTFTYQIDGKTSTSSADVFIYK